MADMRVRLREVMREQGTNPSRLATDVGLSNGALRHYFSGATNSLRGETLIRLARHLGVSLDYLTGRTNIRGEPPPETDPTPPVTFLPATVRGTVQAGQWSQVEALQAPVRDPIPVPAQNGAPADAHWAELVQGDSMDKLYPPGTYVGVIAIEHSRALRDGDRVVVERTRDGGALIERTLKEVRTRAGVVELWPRSTNPLWSSPVTVTTECTDEVRIVGRVVSAYVPEPM